MKMSKYQIIIKTITICFFWVFIIQLNAQEIGKSWEFNEDGNFEGISLSGNFKDSLVENGSLKATVANVFPFVSSEPFEVEASDFGIVQLRMKIPGASSGKLNWYNDTGDWGFITFDATGDSTFQEFELPVYLNAKWVGKITKIMTLGFNPTVGSQVEIDYIRIVRIGPKPSITNFTPIRVIFKQNEEIPLFATVMNQGDVETQLNSILTLPEGVILGNGSLENDHGTMFRELTDSLNWTIMFNDLGEYDLSLRLFNESDTTEKIYSFKVTDKYWEPEKFLLSTWSPPYAWYGQPYEDTVFSYYKNANIDNMLWARDDDALIQKAQQYGLKYYLLITNIIGEEYLRAPNKEVPPDVTEEMLQKLDVAIDKYKDDPNLLGYHICDEPHKQAFPNIGKVVERIREKDPTKLSFVNIWPSGNEYQEYIDGLLQICKLELLSYDRYHFHNGYDEEASYFSNLNVIRKNAIKYDIPFCNIIQAIGTNGTVEEDLNWRTPNRAEHRWLVYSSLAFGVHGLVWFHWHLDWGLTGNPDREIIYPSIQSINAEIDSLSQIMLHLTTTGAYHTITNENSWKLPSDGIVKTIDDNANLVVGYFKDDDDNEDYFMLMNKDYTDTINAQVTLNFILDSLQVFNVEEDKWEQVEFANSFSGAVFNLPLRAGGGKLLKLAGETIVSVLDAAQTPAQFKLEQNYPNPFNPSTTIRYSIPSVGTHGNASVRLVVYDILGREVTTLVNKVQKPGNYEVKFDASNLTSGLYFYKITSGSFMKTMKMILLR